MKKRPFIILGLFVILLLGIPLTTSNAYYLHTFVMILFYAYLATSWNIVGGYAGQLSIGHSAFLTIGAYVSTLLFMYLGMTPWIGMLIGGLVAALFAVLLGIPSFRLRGAYYSLATIAFAQGLMIILMTVEQVGPIRLEGAIGIMLTPSSGFLSFQFMSKVPYYYIILGLLAIVLFISWFIERSKLGYYLTALREDEEAAKALGINTQKVKLIAAGLSAFFTAIGGTFFVQLIRYVDPETVCGMNFSTQMVFLAVVGGLGTVFGPFVGAIILTTLATVTQVYLGSSSSGLHLIIYGAAVIAVILFMPAGEGIVHYVFRWLGLDESHTKKKNKPKNGDKKEIKEGSR